MENKKAVTHIPKEKINAVKELANLIDSKRTVLVADISNIPGSQFQQIGKKLRGKALVKVPKKNLLFRALDSCKKKVALGLKEQIKESVALLFSDLESYELAGELIRNKSPAKAKPGQTAPIDIEVPAGPTELVPGPAISELGALGIQIQIRGGKIEIKQPKVVAQEGKAISPGVADILSKLDIKPFTIGFIPLSAFDSQEDKIYLEIKIDSEEALESLKEAYGRALPFAVDIGYNTEEIIKIKIGKAVSQEKKLIRVINGEAEEEVVVEEKEVEAPKEEKKEEEKAPAGEGLASLFG